MPRLADHQPDERLVELKDIGSNPGNLLAWTYTPEDLRPGAPLVVVLHGCTQSAGIYNRGAGWTNAADEHGFALLFPEQQRANNPNLCFNWYSRPDSSRDGGEPLSIVQMVRAMCARDGLDPDRVFVTGLSAGGAMAVVMLATYPDVFAGGASIAGLPFGTATSVPEAFERMRGQAEFGPKQLTALARSASRHGGEWPSLSVWHGSSDRTVDASNAAALIDQWRGLHGLPDAPSSEGKVAGHLRRGWHNREGRAVLEEYVIADMGHGTPIDAASAEFGETAGPYMIDVGISSTREIVRFWGLEGVGEPSRKPARRAEPAVDRVPVSRPPSIGTNRKAPSGNARPGPREVIEKALKAAGLMR